MWNKAYSGLQAKPAKCWSTELLANSLSVIHVVMDFILLATPMVILWKVQLSKAKKIRLYVVFSVGALSCVASIIRQLAQKHINMDITYGYTTLLAWTVVDLTLAIMVASLPVVSALLPAVFRQLTGTSNAYNTTRQTGAGVSTITGSRAVTTIKRRNTGDSDEGGILREHEIEMSYTIYKAKNASDDGSAVTGNAKEAAVSWNAAHGHEGG